MASCLGTWKGQAPHTGKHLLRLYIPKPKCIRSDEILKDCITHANQKKFMPNVLVK